MSPNKQVLLAFYSQSVDLDRYNFYTQYNQTQQILLIFVTTKRILFKITKIYQKRIGNLQIT